MSSYAESLLDFYGGEVGGEAAYSALLGSARNAEERLKLGSLLQLETETKAWLRAPMLAHGVSIEEQTADRDKGLAAAAHFMPLSWSEQMQRLHDFIAAEFVPRYQTYADSARARGKPDEEAICLYMVEHEKAQLEFARRELKGARLDASLEPIVRFLKYPLKR